MTLPPTDSDGSHDPQKALDEAEVERLRSVFTRRESAELIRIWVDNDRNQHSDEAFEAIRLELDSRNIDSLKQMSPTERAMQGASGGFFSFGMLISGDLIRIVYVLGTLLITWVGAVALLDEKIGYGLVVLIGGNVLWRLVCEADILMFNIHDLLKSIDRKIE